MAPGEVIAGGLVQDVKVGSGPHGPEPPHGHVGEGSGHGEEGHALSTVLLYTGCAMAALIAILMKLVYFDLGVSLTQPKLPPSPFETEEEHHHHDHDHPHILVVKPKKRRIKKSDSGISSVSDPETPSSDGSLNGVELEEAPGGDVSGGGEGKAGGQATPGSIGRVHSGHSVRHTKSASSKGPSPWETLAPKEFRIDPKRHFRHPLQISRTRGKLYGLGHIVLNMCIVVAGRIMEITLEEGHMNNTCRWTLAVCMSAYLLACTLFLGMARGGPQGARRCSKQVRIGFRFFFALAFLATGLLVEDVMSVVGLLVIHCALLLVLVSQELYSRTFRLYRGPFKDKEIASATSLPLLSVHEDKA